VRTTVTLEPDVEALIRRAMRERGVSFKEAVNDAIRHGLASPKPRRRLRKLPVYDMGTPLVPLDKALQLAGALEDEELIRRLTVGK
jgi:hypothetical protein